MKWQQLGIEEICKEIFAGGDAPPKNQRSNEKTEEFSIPIFSNGVEDAGLYGYTNYSRTEEQAITVSARGTIGHIEIRNEPYLPIVRLISLIPDPNKVDIIFLKYSLLASEIFSSGSSIPQLTVPMIKRLVVLLPPLPVQKQIVKKLDAAFADIDKAISATERKLELLTSLKSSILNQAFSDEFTKDPA